MTESEQPKPKNPVGRPTDYKPEYCEDAYKLCLLGCTDAEMAEFFEVSESTLNLWKNVHPEFSESITNGKEKADANVAAKLYHRAIGYEHPEDKIFLGKEDTPVIVPTIKHYPPDTAAAFIWLKNRRSGKWRDRKEITGPDGEALSVQHIHSLGSEDRDIIQAIQDLKERKRLTMALGEEIAEAEVIDDVQRPGSAEAGKEGMGEEKAE